jgi:hypothetical protein
MSMFLMSLCNQQPCPPATEEVRLDSQTTNIRRKTMLEGQWHRPQPTYVEFLALR